MNILSIDVDWCLSNLHQQSLIKLFYSKVNKAKYIYFANHHNAILKILPSDSKYNLFNIDNHHDICYLDEHDEYIKKNLASIGCWIGLLLYNNKISKLNWVRNAESVGINSLSEKYLNESKVSFTVDYTLERLYNHDYDIIFVCKSDEWVDIKYKNLYETFMLSCIELYYQKTGEVKLDPDIPSILLTLNKVCNEK